VATQNPGDFHGTYPLPEPQLDRFLMRIAIGYPAAAAEKEILSSQLTRHPLNEISYVAKAMEVVQAQALVRQVHVAEPIKDYIVALANASRRHPALALGCSPRAALALMRVSQALAAYRRRRHVLPEDVRELLPPVLAHRVTLRPSARSQWERPEAVIRELLEQVPEPEETARLTE